MNKLTFDTLQDAKEFSGIAKRQGYEVSKPIKIKRPSSARKLYDLNGHRVLHRYQITMGAKGAGKRGGKRKDDDTGKKADKEERGYGTCKTCWEERRSLGATKECRVCEATT